MTEVNPEGMLKRLNDNQQQILKYSTNLKAFFTEILDKTCKPFHRKWLNAMENERHLLIKGPRRHGKCVVKNSKVLMANGATKNIENCEKGDEVFAMNENYRLVPSVINKLVDNGKEKCFKIKLKSGKETIVTANHPFYTSEGWKSLENIKNGEKIAIPKYIKREAIKDDLSTEEIKILACLIAEGGLSGKGRSFSNGNISLIRELNEILPSVGSYLNHVKNYDYYLASYEDGIGQVTERYDNGRVKNFTKRKGLFQEWLDEMGIDGKHSFEKQIPEIIFKLPERKIEIFLEYLWICDGTINKNHRGYIDISLSTSSEKLSRQTQQLLEFVGISSSIYPHKTDNRQNYQVVIIGGRNNKLRFLDSILEKKDYKVKDSIKNRPSKSTVNLIPDELFKETLNETPNYYRKRYSLRIDNHYDRNYYKAEKFLDLEPNNKQLESLIHNDIRWDEIKEIEKVGIKQTYGLEVDNYHNHIIDGIISHNTTCSGAYALWKVLVNPDINVFVVTLNQTNANKMMTFIKDNLERNRKIKDIFGQQKSTRQWSMSSIRVKDQGVGNEMPTVSVQGMGGSMIGSGYDLIILDDITDEKSSRTELKRKRIRDWFTSVLMPMLNPDGEIIIIGTKWREGDIYDTISMNSSFKVIENRAVQKWAEEEGGPKVLWPEEWPYERLMENKELMGSVKFNLQYQNKIINQETAVFKQNWIDRAVASYHKPPNLKKYMGVDLSAAKKGEKGDYFAISVIGVDEENNIYDLYTVRTKGTIWEKINLMEKTYKDWRPLKIGVESGNMQKTVFNIIKDKSDTRLPLIPIKSSASYGKEERAEELSVLFETGRIFLREEHTDLIDELLMFPKGKHDDLQDSLAFALKVSNRAAPVNWKDVSNKVIAKRTSIAI